MKTKVRIVATVTGFMAIAFICMKNVPVGRIVLSVVWCVSDLLFWLCKDTSGRKNRKRGNPI